MTEVVPIRRYRGQVPQEHRVSLDTRLLWLWHQRFGTVQTIYSTSPDILDVTAATLILQAIMAKDLKSIQQLFGRLEGNPLYDTETMERGAVRI
jgi:hypothetical protein